MSSIIDFGEILKIFDQRHFSTDERSRYQKRINKTQYDGKVVHWSNENSLVSLMQFLTINFKF